MAGDRLPERVRTVDQRGWVVASAQALRRLLPGDAGYGDPLSTGGDRAHQALARRVTALEPERASASRELALAGLQVWQALSESQGRGRGDQELTILFSDLVDFSSWALEVSDDVVVELLRAVSVAVEGRLTERRGRVVKRMGDGLMATFQSAPDAVGAAFAAQAAIAEVEVADYRPRLRVGVHTGRPRRVGGDYLGVDVNVAARVVDAARAGEVLISDATWQRLDPETVSARRRLWFRARGAPRDLGVHSVRPRQG